MELHLPEGKLKRVRVSVDAWLPKRSGKKREIASLVGLLQHAATVVKPGRTFIRRMFDRLTVIAKPNHHVRLNAGFRSDLAWWQMFLEDWNGVSMLSSLGVREPDEAVTSDASGHWGCGAYWRSVWFQLAWEDPSQRENIATQEQVPIVVAAAIWGRHWHGLHIRCNSDNQAVVAVLLSRTSKDQEIMHLLRCLFFFEASFNFSVSGAYLPGRLNELADDLSRDRSSSFLQKAPHMQSQPTQVPQLLRDLLLGSKPDWTSPSWIIRFSPRISGLVQKQSKLAGYRSHTSSDRHSLLEIMASTSNAENFMKIARIVYRLCCYADFRADFLQTRICGKWLAFPNQVTYVIDYIALTYAYVNNFICKPTSSCHVVHSSLWCLII